MNKDFEEPVLGERQAEIKIGKVEIEETLKEKLEKIMGAIIIDARDLEVNEETVDIIKKFAKEKNVSILTSTQPMYVDEVKDYPFIYEIETDYNQYVVKYIDCNVIGIGDTLEEAIKVAEDNLKFYLDYCNEKKIQCRATRFRGGM